MFKIYLNNFNYFSSNLHPVTLGALRMDTTLYIYNNARDFYKTHRHFFRLKALTFHCHLSFEVPGVGVYVFQGRYLTWRSTDQL